MSNPLYVELFVPVVDFFWFKGHKAFPGSTFSQLEPISHSGVEDAVLERHSKGPRFGFHMVTTFPKVFFKEAIQKKHKFILFERSVV